VENKLKKMLMANDLSARSYRALQGVVALAGDVDAELTIVKNVDDSQSRAIVVVDLPFKTFLDAEAKWEYVRSEQTRISDLLEHVLAQLRGDLGEAMPQAQACVLEGYARTIIREGLERSRPDLVAVGTHSKSVITSAVLGSVAEDLLADAPLDVLAVKADG